MSYITKVGNLAKIPKLREGEHGPYLYARILVTDRVRRNGEWGDGPTVPYEVAVHGRYALNLHRTASKTGGSVRVLFSGREWTDEFTPNDGPTRLIHKVKADEIGISLEFDAMTMLPGEEHESTRAAVLDESIPQATRDEVTESGAFLPPVVPNMDAGAAAYEEMQRRVATVVEHRYFRTEHAQQLMIAAETLVQNPSVARSMIWSVLEPWKIPAAAQRYLMSVVDQLEGTGGLLTWNEAAVLGDTPVTHPRHQGDAAGYWDAIAQARREVHGDKVETGPRDV